MKAKTILIVDSREVPELSGTLYSSLKEMKPFIITNPYVKLEDLSDGQVSRRERRKQQRKNNK